MAEIQPQELLRGSAIEAIHRESLRILSEIGVAIDNERVLDVLQEHGARVDVARRRVRIPDRLVTRLVAQAVQRESEELAPGRGGGAQETKGWMSEGNLPYVLDYRTKRLRKGTTREMLRAVALGNRLEHIERVSCLVKEATRHRAYSHALNYYLLFKYSCKRHFMGVVDSLKTARCVTEMAKVVADSPRQLRDGRLVEFELEAARPLAFSRKSLDIALAFAREGMKIQPGGWFWMGYHTPMTFAAAVALSNANILAALVIVMLVNPQNAGFSYLFGTQSLIPGVKSASPSFGSPNQVIFAIAGRRMADFYGFQRCVANVGLSDSRGMDWRSGFERGASAALAIAWGVSRIGLLGIVGADRAVSFEQLVFDNEMLSYLNYVFGSKISADPAALRYSEIRRAGIGGFFDSASFRRNIEGLHSYSGGSGDDWDGAASFQLEPAIGKDQSKELDRILHHHIGNTFLHSKLSAELRSLTK